MSLELLALRIAVLQHRITSLQATEEIRRSSRRHGVKSRKGRKSGTSRKPRMKQSKPKVKIPNSLKPNMPKPPAAVPALHVKGYKGRIITNISKL